MSPRDTQRIPFQAPASQPHPHPSRREGYWQRHQPLWVVALITIALLALVGLLGGCETNPAGPLTRPVVVTNEVIRAITNTVVREIHLPPERVVVTNVVQGNPVTITNLVEAAPVYFTNTFTSWSTNLVERTNWIANPDLLAGIETARRVNGALNPTPSAPLVDWGLSILGGIAALAAGWQTRRANRAGLAVDTVIKAVETYPGKELDQVKEHIQRVSELTGADQILHDRVQSVTEEITGALSDGRMDANEILGLAKDPRVQEDQIPGIYREAFRALRRQMTA